MKQQTMWAVDLPDVNDIQGAWINIDYFGTRREAIQWVADNLGVSLRHAAVFVSKVGA